MRRPRRRSSIANSPAPTRVNEPGSGISFETGMRIVKPLKSFLAMKAVVPVSEVTARVLCRFNATLVSRFVDERNAVGDEDVLNRQRDRAGPLRVVERTSTAISTQEIRAARG